jgi:hypothetical protein
MRMPKIAADRAPAAAKASAAAPDSSDGGDLPGDQPAGNRGRATRLAGLRALLGQHWLAVALLGIGLALRVLTQVSYHPAIVYIDSVKYLYGAWPGQDPLGYDAPLKLILLAGDLGTVELVQHLLGLAVAVLLYVLLLRRGVPRWLAAVAMAPVLLDGYQLQIEATIMPDVWFEALIVAGLACLLWKPVTSWRACIAGGILLGGSALFAQVGEILIIPAVILMVAEAGGWRQVVKKTVVVACAFALPVLVYCAGNYMLSGHFWLTREGYQSTYGRVAAAADCATLKIPAAESALCPTPGQQARGPDWLMHGLASPLRFYKAPGGGSTTALISNFNSSVIKQQPLRVFDAIARDSIKLFALSRMTNRGDTRISRWQFQTSYPCILPTVCTNAAGTIILGVNHYAFNGPTDYIPLTSSYGGQAQVWGPGARILRDYQLSGGYTPGPVFLLSVLIGLAGSLAVLRRRASAAQRQLTLACLAFFTAAASVLVMSDLFEFSWRYQLPALVTLPPAGALGLAALLRYARRRRIERATSASAGRAVKLTARAG